MGKHVNVSIRTTQNTGARVWEEEEELLFCVCVVVFFFLSTLNMKYSSCPKLKNICVLSVPPLRSIHTGQAGTFDR